eukprot:959656-Pyramimonas_sp.AAC.1
MRSCGMLLSSQVRPGQQWSEPVQRPSAMWPTVSRASLQRALIVSTRVALACSPQEGLETMVALFGACERIGLLPRQPCFIVMPMLAKPDQGHHLIILYSG